MLTQLDMHDVPAKSSKDVTEVQLCSVICYLQLEMFITNHFGLSIQGIKYRGYRMCYRSLLALYCSAVRQLFQRRRYFIE